MAAYQTVIAVQLGDTGQTLTAQLKDAYGVDVGGPISTGFVELGGGNYSWLGTIPDEQFRGTFNLTASNGRRLVMSVNPTLSGSDGTGDGAVLVDHDYGGVDNYSYRESNGTGIQGAIATAYAKVDYDAGRTRDEDAAARVVTTVGGRWAKKMSLVPGEYVLVFIRPGSHGPDAALLTVA